MRLYEMFREIMEIRHRRGFWGFEYVEYVEPLPAKQLTLRIVRGEVVQVGCPELGIEANGKDDVEALMRFLERFFEAKIAHILGRQSVALFNIPHYFGRVVEL